MSDRKPLLNDDEYKDIRRETWINGLRYRVIYMVLFAIFIIFIYINRPVNVSERISLIIQTLESPFDTNSRTKKMLVMLRSSRYKNLNKDVNPYCPFKCDYTLNRTQLPYVDGVFLQPSEITIDVPKRYSANQIFFSFMREAPGAAYYINYSWLPPYQINVTIGYVPGMDIYSGYDELVPKGIGYFGRDLGRDFKNDQQENNELEWNEVEKAVNRKKKIGYALISHCKTNSQRELYLEEFQRRYPDILHLYGACYGGKCDKETCIEKNLVDYRFYFAFENSVCNGYVTEKFWRLKKLIVPVVLRGSDYLKLAPNGSYIAVDQFSSMKELAAHLDYLSTNQTAYMQYFDWTKHFQLAGPNPFYRSLCNACLRLYEPGRSSAYRSLSEWYSVDRLCDANFVPNLLNQHIKNT